MKDLQLLNDTKAQDLLTYLRGECEKAQEQMDIMDNRYDNDDPAVGISELHEAQRTLQKYKTAVIGVCAMMHAQDALVRNLIGAK